MILHKLVTYKHDVKLQGFRQESLIGWAPEAGSKKGGGLRVLPFEKKWLEWPILTKMTVKGGIYFPLLLMKDMAPLVLSRTPHPIRTPPSENAP